ncbi:MAG: helix-turn-helix domain-containing protein [Vallitaleaceae bacterium]|nr:helix-turn-helix domain-containing protein [Vallitaleaceae bacterium]
MALAYEGLRQFLQQFQKETGLNVVIKDFVGLLDGGTELFEAVQDFYIHKQPYCMYIKSNPRLWDYCLLEKKMIYDKLLKEPVPFYGRCYTGICEYVVPILYKGKVIAALTVGNYRMEGENIEKKLQRMAANNPLDLHELSKNYYESTIDWNPLYMDQIQKLQVVTEYISLTYGNLLENQQKIAKVSSEISKPYILSHALEYLRIHHKEEISLEELARFCHCSKSYLSHQFKKYTQMTLKTYINNLRINSAKELLKEGASITEIAFLVGFKDSNYFSKVFRQLEHITPTEFQN